jgi:hypothetical protein
LWYLQFAYGALWSNSSHLYFFFLTMLPPPASFLTVFGGFHCAVYTHTHTRNVLL